MTAPSHCHVLIPGDWHTRTGGFVYDRRLVLALRAAGWQVDVLRVDGAWPHPSAAERARAAAQIAALPDGACVVADGLAFGVLADEVAPHARRLRWVALVHHPLHLETGLDAAAAQALRERELCGLNVIWDLRPTGPDAWDGGRFYNPDSGQTYDVKMQLTAPDTLEARFYQGASFLGQTKTLSRIARGTSKGWC